MPDLRGRSLPAFLLLASLISISAGNFADAKNGSELLKYLNPMQKKGYLNQSQDRLIKKKAFKGAALPQQFPATPNREIGYFAIIPADKLADTDFLNKVLAHQRVNGLSVSIPWSQLEPAEDTYEWQTLDNILNAANQAGKTVIIRVSSAGVDLPETNSDTPKWVFDAGVKSVNYVGIDGKQHTMPLFWDQTYLAKWAQFVKEFGKRYDSNTAIHSIGITGGGFAGGTSVVPEIPVKEETEKAKADKAANAKLLDVLKKEHGLTPRQVVEHWKYAADIFPKRFQNARLNFNINPPTHNRAGEDMLDEISDYLVYRYGNRVYLTRKDFRGKHGFDDYRVLLKFRNDTFTGVTVPEGLNAEELTKMAKFALDDGISFAEVPVSLVTSEDAAIKTALDKLSTHIGYQIVGQKTTLPTEVATGEPIKASFQFLNTGAATLMRPERQFDKDLPVSYKVQIELKDASGKSVVQNQHTPGTPTTKWTPGEVVTWEEELRMPPLTPGEYTAYMSLIDPTSKRKIQFLDAIKSSDKPLATKDIELGKLKVVQGSPADKKLLESNASKENPGGN
jgi:hypothetical protein